VCILRALSTRSRDDDSLVRLFCRGGGGGTTVVGAGGCIGIKEESVKEKTPVRMSPGWTQAAVEVLLRGRVLLSFAIIA
jgi:hypothetical protein